MHSGKLHASAGEAGRVSRRCEGSSRRLKHRVPAAGEPSLQALSVFFPAYNDAHSLPSLLGTTFEVLSRYVPQFEVIVVNDGSQDATGEVLAALQHKHGSRLRVVTHPENRGYGAALQSGFAAARYEWVFYTDGDGQYDLNDLPHLLEKVGPKIGLVNGFKIARQDAWHRRWIGALYNQTIRSLFRIRLKDVDCDFRLIRRAALPAARLRSTGGTICLELVRLLEASGWETAEVPVKHLPRKHGRSQFFRIKPLAVTFFQLLSMYFRQLTAPLAGKRL